MTVSDNQFELDRFWTILEPSGIHEGFWESFDYECQESFLERLHDKFPKAFSSRVLQVSEEGRKIRSIRLGKGERRILVWARQHGDEPDCTAALMTVLDFLCSNSSDPVAHSILSQLQLEVILMVNPDGVNHFTRRNVNGIDINRDAVAFETAGGRALKKAFDEFQPDVCFNLHDMDNRKTYNTSDLVAVAFQACPFGNEEDSNPQRDKAKRLCLMMAEEAKKKVPRGCARYTANYMPRAFGDNMMKWGVASVLIEAGGWYPDEGGDNFVQKLFACCLLKGLLATAEGEDLQGETSGYEKIPLDDGQKFLGTILEKGIVYNGSGLEPFCSDLAFYSIRESHEGDKPYRFIGKIENIGDLEDYGTLQRINIDGQFVTPGAVAFCADISGETLVEKSELALSYVKRGVTSLVAGFGPYKSINDAREAAERIKSSSLICNLYAFETLESIDVLLERCGQTEFYGVTLKPQKISTQELFKLTGADFTSVSKPVEKSLPENVLCRIFLVNTGNPSVNRLHICIYNEVEDKNIETVDFQGIESLVDIFLKEKTQVSISTKLSCSSDYPNLSFLDSCGENDALISALFAIGNGRTDRDGTRELSALTSSMTRERMRMLHDGSRGLLTIDSIADVVTHRKKLDRMEVVHVAVNGHVVIEDQMLQELEHSDGCIYLARD